VEVGKPLYEIEVDDNTVVATKSNTPTPTPSTPTPNTTSTTTASVDTDNLHRSRTPSIKFLGKRSLLKDVHTTTSQPVSAPQETPSTAQNVNKLTITASKAQEEWLVPKKPQTGVDFLTLKDTAWYGRPKLSQQEIEAIESGGAI
jgi:hypothetical protein